MMNILITGGAGYIGSMLTRFCLSLEGFRVVVLDNFMHGQAPLNDCSGHARFDVVRGDARDANVLRPLLAKADVIFPLAAIVGAPACDANVDAATTTNLHAVRLLASMLSPSQVVVIPITNSGYGIGETNKFCDEETPLRPISHYGRTKVEAEKSILRRENAVSLRLATVFGMSSRMRLDLLVNDFVYRAVNDRAVVLFEAAFKRNYIHIIDVCRAFMHAVDNVLAMRGKAFNVGLSDANLSKLELCEKIKEHVPGFFFTEAALGKDPDQRDYIVSNARIEATGFKPICSLDYGITELIKGYRMVRRTEYGNA